MRFWLLLALAFAGCAKTGVPQAVSHPKPAIPPELLANLPESKPLPERPTHLVRLPNGLVVEEVRP